MKQTRWEIVAAISGNVWGRSINKQAAESKAAWLNDGRVIHENPEDHYVVRPVEVEVKETH